MSKPLYRLLFRGENGIELTNFKNFTMTLWVKQGEIVEQTVNFIKTTKIKEKKDVRNVIS
ncbi:MAG: hypothetical protein R3Y07_06150 [Eubacteriales bacterium]